MTFSNDSIRINADSVSRRTSSRHLSTKRAKLILQASVLILCSRPSVRLIRKPTDTNVCHFSSSSATGATRTRKTIFSAPSKYRPLPCRYVNHNRRYDDTIVIGALNIIIIYYYHSDCRKYNCITELKYNVIIVVISVIRVKICTDI